MFKRQLFLLTIIAVLSFITFNEAYSKQIRKSIIMDTTKTYKIYTKDNTDFTGKFKKKDSVNVTFITNSQTKIEIPLTNIYKIDEIDEIDEIEAPVYKNRKYVFENPNASRYFFSSSAINLKAGQSYYQNTYVFLNSFAIGISNNISIAAGIEFLSTFASLREGDFTPVYFVSPKLGFKLTDNLHLGVGYFYTGIFNAYGNEGSGYLYGVATMGSKNNNFSLTVGFENSGFNFNEDPLIGFSGTIRVSKGVSLITDNIIVPTYSASYYNGYKLEYLPFVSYGIRIFGEKLAVDLAFINNAEISQEIFIGIPYVDFVVNF
ncbi:MAG: hypothetical protein WCR42_08255 [bacterium]